MKTRKLQIVAEIGSNHNGSETRLRALIKRAAECGFDAVKVQLIPPDLFRNCPTGSEHLLPVPLKEARAWATASGLKLGVTVFRPGQVEQAAKYADHLKISSYELRHAGLRQAVLESDCPKVFSCGLSWVDDLVTYRREDGNLWHRPDLTLLHCCSRYPARPDQVGLSRIERLQLAFPSSNVGYSDHTGNLAVVIRAVLHWGARWVEMHLDDGNGMEREHSHANQHQLREAIQLMRMDEETMEWHNATERDWRMDDDGQRPMKG